MNYFAWNIVLKGKPEIKDLDFDYVEIFSKTWNTVLYIFWETEINNSKELEELFIFKIWELNSFDITINTENNIEVFEWDYGEGIYELVSFEGEEVDYENILARFEEVSEVISVRESWISEKFWNKIIKVDFLY